jgi:hypothetical protein
MRVLTLLLATVFAALAAGAAHAADPVKIRVSYVVAPT